MSHKKLAYSVIDVDWVQVNMDPYWTQVNFEIPGN